MRDIQQIRAQSAWAAVDKLKDRSPATQAKYKTWARRLPSMILQCGLLPTLAFYKAKQKEQGEIADACANWLKSDVAELVPWTTQEKDAIVGLQGENSRVYRAAQAEALRWAIWLKRFAEGYLADDDSASQTNTEEKQNAVTTA